MEASREEHDHWQSALTDRHPHHHTKVVDANHLTLIFHDFIDDKWLTLPDELAGREVVQTILDAIAAAQD